MTAKEAAMVYEEKIAWAGLPVSLLTLIGYVAVLLTRASSTPMPDTPYVDAMLGSIGVGVIVMIVISIIAGITARREGHVRDVRDKQIGARAEFTARGVLVIGALAALILAMLEADTFWIAQAIFLGFALSALLEGITKVALYRRGMAEW
ncbi:hypothetical protein [Microcella frigidaquae]|uniref:Putative membrane protein n=2 Tax=Microcella frigidaquae TaxID=424758 RepID=A0A840XPM5_9MICO|nr:hypothetical protein [Microcella frigidaquae]MBB5618767.1 putative membrane protein [Microcella frigidaquae]